MRKKFLIIDGNYFAMRSLGQLNMSKNELPVTLESDLDCQRLKNNLQTNMVNLLQTFNNEKRHLIDNIIYVADNHSWRKDVTPHRPYYISEDDSKVIGYKEQRVATKAESEINYDNFYKVHNEFVSDLRDFWKIGVFCLCEYGFEGDDMLCLISNVLKDEDCESIVFCTDGDLMQTVRPNFHLFRNIRSKEAPNGEVVITQSVFEHCFESKSSGSVVDQFMNTAQLVESSWINDVASIVIGDTDGGNKCIRSLNSGINIAYPFKSLFVKTICGDKKDNIFGLISWKATTGTRNYGITEKVITKVFEKFGLAFTNANCLKMLNMKSPGAGVQSNIEKFLTVLIDTIPQANGLKVEDLLVHFKHNLKMLLLSAKNLPEDVVSVFNDAWDGIKIELFNPEHVVSVDELLQKFQRISPTNNFTTGKDIFAESLNPTTGKKSGKLPKALAAEVDEEIVDLG